MILNSLNKTPNATVIVEKFTLMFCHYVDFPETGIDCTDFNYTASKCVQCQKQGKYLTGNGLVAPPFLYFLWTMLMVVSVVGVFNNVLTILVVRKKETSKSFDFLLIFLSSVDIVVSVFAASGGTANTAYFGNWVSNKSGAMAWGFISLYTREIARSASAYITVVICAKNCLTVYLPTRSSNWFTLRNTRIYAVVSILISLMYGIPRFASYKMVVNPYTDIYSLRDLSSIAEPTAFGKWMYQKLGGIHNKLDYWISPLLILLLVLLSYFKVRKISERRESLRLSKRQMNNMRAGRMFLPVAIFCILTNLVPVTNIILYSKNRTYRELYMIMFISNAVNSAVNFPIYYYRSTTFRQNTKQVVWDIKKRLGLVSGDSTADLELKARSERDSTVFGSSGYATGNSVSRNNVV